MADIGRVTEPGAGVIVNWTLFSELAGLTVALIRAMNGVTPGLWPPIIALEETGENLPGTLLPLFFFCVALDPAADKNGLSKTFNATNRDRKTVTFSFIARFNPT